MKKIKELLNWKLEDIIKMIIGTFMFCIAINVFVVPNNLYTGGVLGISQLIRSVITSIFKIEIDFDIYGLIYYIINIPLFIAAYKNLSKPFFYRTLLVITIQTIENQADYELKREELIFLTGNYLNI